MAVIPVTSSETLEFATQFGPFGGSATAVLPSRDTG